MLVASLGIGNQLPERIDRRSISQHRDFVLLFGIPLLAWSRLLHRHFKGLSFGPIFSITLPLLRFLGLSERQCSDSIFNFILLLSNKLFGIRFFNLLEHLLDIDKWRLIIATPALAACQASIAIGSYLIGLKLKEPVENELTIKELRKLIAVFNQLVKKIGGSLVFLDVVHALLQGRFLV